MSSAEELVEGRDYYLEGEKMVLTTRYLLKRGHCCNSGCRHCPYGDESDLKVDLRIDGLDSLLGESDD
jgi:pyruvate formate-lyase activating enzyme-like uncharacterized protein